MNERKATIDNFLRRRSDAIITVENNDDLQRVIKQFEEAETIVISADTGDGHW